MDYNPITFIQDYHGLGSGWRIEGFPGIYSDYAFALADLMGTRDQYLQYHLDCENSNI